MGKPLISFAQIAEHDPFFLDVDETDLCLALRGLRVVRWTPNVRLARFSC